MLRLTLAALFATLLIAATACGARSVLHARAEAEQQALLDARYQMLAEERARWDAGEIDGPAAAGTRGEAVRTLEVLQQLYAQEQRLWTYYDAVARSHATRSELAAEEAALARRVAEHRRHLERLESTMDHLRPPSEEPGLSFTDP